MNSVPVLTEEKGSRLLYISILAALIGVGTGLIMYVLYHLIALITNVVFYHRVSFLFVSEVDTNIGLLAILMPVIGGALVGLMSKYGTNQIQGHGLPEALEAVVSNKSRIPGKVAIWKPLSAAIVIGTGGPFGAEGPIIQTGGAVGSFVGQILNTTESERRILLACGSAAGLAATFGTPISGVIMAIEILLFEFRTRSFIPLVIASSLATAVRFQLIQSGAMFPIGSLDFNLPYALPYYVILGVICGLTAVFFIKTLYWAEDQFEKLHVSPYVLPSVGALGVGVLGYFVPRIFGPGYDTIGAILENQFVLSALLVILVFKFIALILSLGTRTSGGLLAPVFMIGAAIGGLFAMVVNHLIPVANLSPGAFALVGMGAVFGASVRATFAFIIFPLEMTRNFNSVLPLMLVGVIASGVAYVLYRNSVITEKLVRRGLLIPQDYEADIFKRVPVSDVMDTDVPAIGIDMTIRELSEKIHRGDPDVNRHKGIPIVNAENKLVGIITHNDIRRAVQAGLQDKTVLEVGSKDLILAFQAESLYEAVVRMLNHDIGRLPVVKRDDVHTIVGYLGRGQVISARLKKLAEDGIIPPEVAEERLEKTRRPTEDIQAS
ncbi:MAG: chloride channel protein [Bacteroidetes bacterium]|nr:chloride channel protein [Bacteroidota bacterium]